MANIHFLRKLAVDELKDTLFFATGEPVEKIKNEKYTTLRVSGISVDITSDKIISINNKKYKSIREAKYIIQEMVI